MESALNSMGNAPRTELTGQNRICTLNMVTIDHEPVELCKILKFENLVLSGGEAKHAITGGMVTVNGSVERQKRKKVFAGDIVEFNGKRMKIVNCIKNSNTTMLSKK